MLPHRTRNFQGVCKYYALNINPVVVKSNSSARHLIYANFLSILFKQFTQTFIMQIFIQQETIKQRQTSTKFYNALWL